MRLSSVTLTVEQVIVCLSARDPREQAGWAQAVSCIVHASPQTVPHPAIRRTLQLAECLEVPWNWWL